MVRHHDGARVSSIYLQDSHDSCSESHRRYRYPFSCIEDRKPTSIVPPLSRDLRLINLNYTRQNYIWFYKCPPVYDLRKSWNRLMREPLFVLILPERIGVAFLIHILRAKSKRGRLIAAIGVPL